MNELQPVREPVMTDAERHALEAALHANRIDRDLRRAARGVTWAMLHFKELLTKAKEDGIHQSLGFESWPVYVADVIRKGMRKLPAADRAQITALLIGEGMSNRCVADALGVSKSTVSRDRQVVAQIDEVMADGQVSHGGTPAPAPSVTPTTGRDGKSYRRTPPRPKPKRERPPTASENLRERVVPEFTVSRRAWMLKELDGFRASLEFNLETTEPQTKQVAGEDVQFYTLCVKADEAERLADLLREAAVIVAEHPAER